MDLFTNTVPVSREKYLVVDAARYGGDRIVFTVWEGLKCVKMIIRQKQGIDVTARMMRELSAEYHIPFSHCLCDDDGVGGGVVDINRGMKGFVNNSTALEVQGKKENYANLKAQCSYLLAEYINNHNLRVDIENEDVKQDLIQELEQIKSKDRDKDQKLRILPKEDVKEIIGRSPDLADTLMMRMYFELRQPTTTPVTQYIPNYKQSTYGQRIPSITGDPRRSMATNSQEEW